MREILFRGKPTKEALNNPDVQEHIKDGWVYGNLIWNRGSPYIVGDIVDGGDEYIAHEWWVPVVPETVGQSIGMGLGVKLIYEGDITYVNGTGLQSLSDEEQRKNYYGVVVWEEERWRFAIKIKVNDYKTVFIETGHRKFGSVANIHDNPELLEGA